MSLYRSQLIDCAIQIHDSEEETEALLEANTPTISRIMRSARSSDLASLLTSDSRSISFLQDLADEQLPWSVTKHNITEPASEVSCPSCDDLVRDLQTDGIY